MTEPVIVVLALTATCLGCAMTALGAASQCFAQSDQQEAAGKTSLTPFMDRGETESILPTTSTENTASRLANTRSSADSTSYGAFTH